jgi:hypothetical protein
MFQYPARRIMRATTPRGTMQHVNLYSHPGPIVAWANPGLIQIKHRHGEIILSCGDTTSAEQLAVSSRPGTISHVWSR